MHETQNDYVQWKKITKKIICLKITLKILENYPKEKDKLVAILNDVQERFGYVPEKAQEEILNYPKRNQTTPNKAVDDKLIFSKLQQLKNIKLISLTLAVSKFNKLISVIV